MRWPPPTPATLRALHAATGLPLLGLALWFGKLDRLPFGGGRCHDCGVEGYVIAAHAVVAVVLGLVVAALAAARRELVAGVRSPGAVTRGALAAAALFLVGCLGWHPLLDVPAFAAMIASIVVAPVGFVWWLLSGVGWWRAADPPAHVMQQWLGLALRAAWIGLLVVLPGVFGFVWADRVEWLVF